MDLEFREKTSKELLRAAWIVEIVAVLMGLAISVAVGFDGWDINKKSLPKFFAN